MWLGFLILAPVIASITDETCLRNSRILSEQVITVNEKSSSSLDLFVYHGEPYSLTRAFSDVFLVTNISDSDSFNLYQGPNCSVVLDEYQADNRLFGLLKSVSSWRSHQLDIFNDSVVGIDTYQAYNINVRIWKINYIRVAIFVGAIALFFFASKLVRNTLFYYSSGCSFGLIASVLLVAFIVWRVAPKKTIGLPILVGGWSVSIYMLHFAWKNFSSIIMQYQKAVAAYFMTALVVSFVICYKRGPPTDARSHDIAQWTLQLVALAAIFLSSQVPELSLSVIGILVLHQITKSWLFTFSSYLLAPFTWIYRKFVPYRKRLLTQEEYEREGTETTKRELDRLRSYCKSPDANVWRIANTVKNPRSSKTHATHKDEFSYVGRSRLARFVDGLEDHVSDEEELLHEREAEYLDDDEDSDDRQDEDVNVEDDEDEWVHEVIISKRPTLRSARTTPVDSNQFNRQKFFLPKHVAQQLLSNSARVSQSSSRIPVRQPRRSLATMSEMRLTSSRSYQPDDFTPTGSRTTRLRQRRPNLGSGPSMNRNDFISSDSDEDTQLN